MSKVYILTDKDFERLFDRLKRDPDHGTDGHGTMHQSDQARRFYREAHKFFHYQVYGWVKSVKESED